MKTDAQFQLLPHEKILWEGAPTLGVPRQGLWHWVPWMLGTMAVVVFLFAVLMQISHLSGAGDTVGLACYLAIMGAASRLLPRYFFDHCAFAVTDRRVLWRMGKMQRSIDRTAITFTRIRWHRRLPQYGTLEFVRAVPFGPLARQQRLVFHDLRTPDEVLAMIRRVAVGPGHGDAQVPLADRLDPDEEVVWGAGPEGYLMGWREVLTSLAGGAVLVIGIRYLVQAFGILLDLEAHGLVPGSWVWLLLASAMLLTATVIFFVGGGLAWYGVGRSRMMGRQTEYILTDRRLLIRRGLTELSLDRRHIVDIAEVPRWRGVRNIHLILDAPGARALADSGALSVLAPPRNAVPPVLYEVRDAEQVRTLLAAHSQRKPRDGLR